MEWKVRELKSREVLESGLNNEEKELIKLYVNSAIKEKINRNGRGQYSDGIQTGIAQTLKLLKRDDIWALIGYEFRYHKELN